MARIRTIKPAMWESEQLGAVSIGAHLLFVGLISHADDDGKLKAHPRLVRGKVFGNRDDVTTGQVERWLDDLHEVGLIDLYGSRTGVLLARIPNFSLHQRMNRHTDSVLPDPSAAHPMMPRHKQGRLQVNDDTRTPDVVREHSGRDAHAHPEGKGRGREEEGKGSIDRAHASATERAHVPARTREAAPTTEPANPVVDRHDGFDDVDSSPDPNERAAQMIARLRRRMGSAALEADAAADKWRRDHPGVPAVGELRQVWEPLDTLRHGFELHVFRAGLAAFAATQKPVGHLKPYLQRVLVELAKDAAAARQVAEHEAHKPSAPRTGSGLSPEEYEARRRDLYAGVGGVPDEREDKQ